MRKLIFVLLISVSFSCSQKTTKDGEASVVEIVAAFPVNELAEMIEEISPAERDDLLKKGESENWLLSVKDEANDQLVIKNKSAQDNSVSFIVYRTKANSVLVGVQQLNAQVSDTKLWQYTLFQPEDNDPRWTSYPLPEIAVKDFLAEDVTFPTKFEDMEVRPYLDISLSQKSLHYTLNKWTFLKEIAEYYQSQSDPLETSYVKYQFDWDWNGTEFIQRKTTLNEYDEVITAIAYTVEENPDGPGINEFDCPHGVSASASTILAAEGNNKYTADNVLDGKDETAWAVPNGGQGQSLIFTLTEDFQIGNTYQIRTGYTKSKALWTANNRVKKFKVFVNNKFAAKVLLQDIDGYQSFSITPAWKQGFMDSTPGDQIRFEIEEIYKGDKYNDTLVSYFVPTGNCG